MLETRMSIKPGLTKLSCSGLYENSGGIYWSLIKPYFITTGTLSIAQIQRLKRNKNTNTDSKHSLTYEDGKVKWCTNI